jgi:hypothetical protein
MKKISLLILCLFAAITLKADLTPEPQILYRFKYFTGTPLEINPLLSEQIQCSDNQCHNAEPLGVYGIQKLTCTKDDCAAVAYQFKPFQKLVITFADGTVMESPVYAAPKTLKSAMQINVYDDRMEVVDLPYIPQKDALSKTYITASFAAILILETLVALVFLIVAELPLSLLIYAVTANILSAPFNWYILSSITPNNGIIWTTTFVFELLFIYILGRKRITFGETAGMVFVMNVASYSVGMATAYMFTFF